MARKLWDAVNDYAAVIREFLLRYLCECWPITTSCGECGCDMLTRATAPAEDCDHICGRCDEITSLRNRCAELEQKQEERS